MFSTEWMSYVVFTVHYCLGLIGGDVDGHKTINIFSFAMMAAAPADVTDSELGA